MMGQARSRREWVGLAGMGCWRRAACGCLMNGYRGVGQSGLCWSECEGGLGLMGYCCVFRAIGMPAG